MTDPSDTNSTTTPFRIDYPDYFNYAFDVLDQKAVVNRNRVALLWVSDAGDERKFTFWELSVWSNRTANFLQGLGIEKGDRVLVMLPRIPEWWVTMLALMKVGAVAVPSAVFLTPKDIEYRCKRANVKAIVTDADGAAKVEACRDRIPTVEHFIVVDGAERRSVANPAAPPNAPAAPVHSSAPAVAPAKPNTAEPWISFGENVESASRSFIPLNGSKHTRLTDPFVLYFTSGTTGLPKIVVHDYSYTLAHRVTAELWHGLEPTDVLWTITDTGWAKIAWGAFFGQWYVGATVFICDYRQFRADRILSLLEKYGVTVFCAPPSAYRKLILEDLKRYDLSELRRCVSAGEPLNPEVIQVWKKNVGHDLFEGYGQTESVLMIGTFPGMKVKPGAMGFPAPIFDVQLLDENLHPVAVGEVGEIAVRVKPVHPRGLFRGYLDDDELNHKVFRDGWYLTGDRARKDEDGYLWFIGRSDDIIKSSGYRIGPFEVESALLEHEAVVEAAVVGVPDRMKGQRVKAFVVLAPGFTGSEELVKSLQSHVKKVTAPYKCPKEIEFVPDLPKTISAKIRRVELREREAGKEGDGIGN